MQKKLIRCGTVTLLMAILLTIPAWAGSLKSFADLQGTLDIAGGTAHIPVMNEAAKRIMTANPKIRITVTGGGTGIGVQKAGEGLVDIGNTGRALSAEEVARFGLRSFAFAVDGVAPVVHSDNPVAGLSVQQVRDIFAGRITHWQAVGGPDAAIHVYGREEASGTHEVFWKKLLNKETVVGSANIIQSNGAMKVAVSRDIYAIGYMSIGHIDDSVKPLAVDGVLPSQATAIDGTYPAVRQLYMNTKGDPKPLARAFIDYILSAEGAGIIRAAGYIPLQ
ncbi:phosphate ABC transporter substrate-binding protein [Desulfatitalea alkaliphila]|uniref:Phosphate-binding protein n=1 Tax=Desulfatitalea alkaliphila TaxID=2929485 RepID=A0AA41R1V7_9BACT|nr:phosphate ABC transporter substrate-binding protein [Desulfatitalea alkaliphila]MCJ8499256.1 phosphate ABC transporter substrate-binding protein [Desulfatitalea alkaliphila]